VSCGPHPKRRVVARYAHTDAVIRLTQQQINQSSPEPEASTDANVLTLNLLVTCTRGPDGFSSRLSGGRVGTRPTKTTIEARARTSLDPSASL